MKKSLLYFISLFLFSSCSEFNKNDRNNIDKIVYVDTQNMKGDYRACYVHNIIKTWKKEEISGIMKLTSGRLGEFQTISFVEINPGVEKPQRQSEKVVIAVYGGAVKEGTLYFIEGFVLEEGKWHSKGNRKEFKIMNIHPEDKSPYGLDVDEICEQMVSNTIRIILQ